MDVTFTGIDLGTSGCRACLVNSHGKLLKEVRAEFPAPACRDTEIEQDAEIWWQTVKQLLTELSEHHEFRCCQAIAVDGTSSTVLVTDKEYRPLGPALMYNDSRASTEATQLKSLIPANSPALGASSSLSKLLWLTKRYPQATHALHQADFISGRLSGNYLSDFNNSLKMGYDPVSESWPDWMQQLPIDPALLPAVVAPGTVTGYLDTKLADLLGLDQDVMIVAGTTDSIAGFLATGAHETGDAVVSLGSTLVIKLISPVAINAPEYGIYSHRVNNHWLVGGASNCGGAILKELFSDSDLHELTARLDFSVLTGLDYYPLLSPGERFPTNDPGKLPRLEPRPADDRLFFQAILEALTRIEADGFAKLQQLGAAKPGRLYTVGGGTRNPAWMHFRQQQIGVPVIIPEYTEACYGSARLAMQAYFNKQN